MSIFSSFADKSYLIMKLLMIPGMIMFFTFRGFFQAFVAKKLGDDSPERQGFYSLNPLKHINIIGFIMLILCGFGFGKPMHFSSTNYKHYKLDSVIQILSAPFAGIILALVEYTTYAILVIIGAFTKLGSFEAYQWFAIIFEYAAELSITLSVFLFLPLPGFDSFRLIELFIPYSGQNFIRKIERYSLFIFIGFILLLEVPYVGDAIQYYLITIPSNFLLSIISIPGDALITLFENIYISNTLSNINQSSENIIDSATKVPASAPVSTPNA